MAAAIKGIAGSWLLLHVPYLSHSISVHKRESICKAKNSPDVIGGKLVTCQTFTDVRYVLDMVMHATALDTTSGLNGRTPAAQLQALIENKHAEKNSDSKSEDEDGGKCSEKAEVTVSRSVIDSKYVFLCFFAIVVSHCVILLDFVLN